MKRKFKNISKLLVLSICCVSIFFGSSLSTNAYSIVENKMILGPVAIDLAYYSLWDVQSQPYTLYGEIRAGDGRQLVEIIPIIDYCLYSEGTSGSYTSGYMVSAASKGMTSGKQTNSVYLAYSDRIVRYDPFGNVVLTARGKYKANYNYPDNGTQSGNIPTYSWNFGK